MEIGKYYCVAFGDEVEGWTGDVYRVDLTPRIHTTSVYNTNPVYPDRKSAIDAAFAWCKEKGINAELDDSQGTVKEMTQEQADAILVKDRDERHPSAWWSMTSDYSRYGPAYEIHRSFFLNWWIEDGLQPLIKSSSNLSIADAMQKLMAQIAEVPSAR